MSAMLGGGAGGSASAANLLNGLNAMNGLDMDISLPMDLDMDLSQAGTDGAFGMTPQHQHQPSTTSAPTDQTRGLMVGGMGGQHGQQQDANMTGVGAGPLPTGFGLPTQQSSSTLTEFTKRRNWSQRIIEELKDFLHILTPDGRILYVSPSCKAITGYEPHTLIGKFIGEYVHPDDSGIFMREFNESIASGNSLRFFYRFKKDDGTYMIFECDGHPQLPRHATASQTSHLQHSPHAPEPGLSPLGAET